MSAQRVMVGLVLIFQLLSITAPVTAFALEEDEPEITMSTESYSDVVSEETATEEERITGTKSKLEMIDIYETLMTDDSFTEGITK